MTGKPLWGSQPKSSALRIARPGGRARRHNLDPSLTGLHFHIGAFLKAELFGEEGKHGLLITDIEGDNVGVANHIEPPLLRNDLPMMLAAGLVERRTDGRKRIYRLLGDLLGELSLWLDIQRDQRAKALGGLNPFLDRRS